MKFIAYLTMALFPMISIPALASESDAHGAHEINDEARNAWIRQKALDLKSYQPGSDQHEIPWQQSYRVDAYVTGCRVSKSGILRMGTSEWVYVETSSSHDQPEVGDVIIAIDSKGNLYQHHGHVCGGIINFRSTDTEIPSSSEDFFRKFTDDVQEMPWIPLVIP